MKNTLAASALAVILVGSIAYAEPKVFDSPEAAVAAVIDALKARDREALIATFGPENEDVILSDDPERDRDDWTDFMNSYNELNRIAVQQDGSARLYIGDDQWPFPITMVQTDGGWSFDADAAREEMLETRIGLNELDVIDLLKGYVRVQGEFRQTDYDGDGVMEFASHIISATDKRDGLYWPPAPGVPESPVGDFIARAAASGYSIDGRDVEPEPYLGYYFHVLTEQGEAAPGGAMDYMVNGNMVGGHALIAFPAEYGETGIMSFMVGENGVIYEADLGEETLDIADKIESFDPGDDWEILVEES
ncbi:DUF2950 domain-containing protein [Rhodobacteraceae bacterium NNCM2]|nr:DUF2950 domain-containing protein [Coraliihabitans acroporae]